MLSSEASSTHPVPVSLICTANYNRSFTAADCTVSTTDHSLPDCSVLRVAARLMLKFTLNATGSSSAINHCLSLLSLYSKLLTDIILYITEQDFSTDESLERIGLYHDEGSNLRALCHSR